MIAVFCQESNPIQWLKKTIRGNASAKLTNVGIVRYNPAMPLFPFKREQLKAGEVLCAHCTALCCRYFSVPIETPTTRREFDYVRWFMLHGRVTCYVEDGTWYLCVYGDCKHILPDYRCGIYETRPQICRDYSTNKCEYD